jgi:hypothetical protein
MMREIILSGAVAYLMSATANAQTFDVPAPASGDFFQYEGFDASAADTLIFGEGATWDFSEKTANSFYAGYSYREPNPTELQQNPQSNLVRENQVDGSIAFYTVTGDSLSFYGDANIVYDNPDIRMFYPMDDNAIYNDEFSYHYTSQGVYVTAMAVCQMTAVGQGMLLTGYGSYPDAKKIRRKLTYSLSAPGQPSITVHVTQYIWYTEDLATHILSVSRDDYNGQYIAEVLIDDSAAGIEENTAGSFMVYPNPSSDEIKWEEPGSGFSLFDQTGRQVLGGSGNSASIRDLPKGAYTLIIRTETGNISRKVIRN